MTAVQRYAHVNTRSRAGRAELVAFDSSEVVGMVRVWVNTYGNPSYTMRLRDGRVLYLVDDYGALNDLSRVPVCRCERRHELFDGVLP